MDARFTFKRNRLRFQLSSKRLDSFDDDSNTHCMSLGSDNFNEDDFEVVLASENERQNESGMESTPAETTPPSAIPAAIQIDWLSNVMVMAPWNNCQDNPCVEVATDTWPIRDNPREEEDAQVGTVSSLEKRLHVQKREKGSEHPSVSRALYSLAIELQRCKRYDEAMARLREAMRLVANRDEEESEEMANILLSMGNICYANKMFEEAVKHYKSSLYVLIASGLWDDHPKIMSVAKMIEKVDAKL